MHLTHSSRQFRELYECFSRSGGNRLERVNLYYFSNIRYGYCSNCTCIWCTIINTLKLLVLELLQKINLEVGILYGKLNTLLSTLLTLCCLYFTWPCLLEILKKYKNRIDRTISYKNLLYKISIETCNKFSVKNNTLKCKEGERTSCVWRLAIENSLTQYMRAQ